MYLDILYSEGFRSWSEYEYYYICMTGTCVILGNANMMGTVDDKSSFSYELLEHKRTHSLRERGSSSSNSSSANNRPSKSVNPQFCHILYTYIGEE